MASSCGLENYVTFYAPSENSPSSTSPTRILVHNTLNTSLYFRGYQVYYRIYASDSNVTSPTAAASDASVIESSLSTTTPDTVVTRLKNAGYKQVVGLVGSSSASPLISVAAADVEKTIIAKLDFNAGTAVVSVGGVDQTASPYETRLLRRAVTNSLGEYRTFGDSAISDDCSSTTGKYFWIRMYAVAYGIDNSFYNIYSLPLVLANTILLGEPSSTS
jgi:hypothetical protein